MPEESVHILGIESSCDDTAAAVVSDGELRSSIISTQQEHVDYGGVVPEIASRAHEQHIVPVVTQALDEAGVSREQLAGVAVTFGPGLAGSLLVGLSFGKAFAFGLDIPLVGVDHLEGHIFSAFIEEPRPRYPFLCLIVSGGHTRLVLSESPTELRLLGKTRDDAAGEAFDKVGRLLGLPYPGGPAIDRHAENGDATFRAFPRASLEGYDFSFSGIKTSVLYYLDSLPDREAVLAEHLPDLCASFQRAVVEMLVEPLGRAIDSTGVADVAIVGGVSANRELRREAASVCDEHGVRLIVPKPEYCTDNAAMIAMAGYQRYRAGRVSPLTLTVEPARPAETYVA